MNIILAKLIAFKQTYSMFLLIIMKNYCKNILQSFFPNLMIEKKVESDFLFFIIFFSVFFFLSEKYNIFLWIFFFYK